MEKEPKKKRGRPKKSETPDCDFGGHLEHIRKARGRASEIIQTHIDAGKNSQAAIALAWEVVFDFFLNVKNDAVELSELNTLAGVIQKLVSADAASKSGGAERSEKKGGSGLSEDGIREIERRLKLL